MKSRALIKKYLPTEPELIHELSERDLGRLSCTCWGVSGFFTEPLRLSRLAYSVIVNPDDINKMNVITMMCNDPMLLKAKISEIEDKAGRVIRNKTLFQLAYGAGDDDYCQAMKPIFVKHCGSEAAAIQEMARQRQEIIDGQENQRQSELEKKAYLQFLLQPVIAAITAEKFNLGRNADNKLILSSATLAIIATFRNELKRWMISGEKGLQFPYAALMQTYNTYTELAAVWKYDYYQCVLFEDSILASLLFYVPENDAQKLAQGLYLLQECNEPFKRSFALREGGKNFYDVLQGSSSLFVLSGSCIDIGLGCQTTPLYGKAAGDARRIQYLSQTKLSNLDDLFIDANNKFRLDM